VKRLLPLLALLLLTACNREQDSAIEPVPAQTAQSANRLMGAAERAAGNAAERMGSTPEVTTTSPTITENQQ
jgi:uncharacterized lipoprotein YajG